MIPYFILVGVPAVYCLFYNASGRVWTQNQRKTVITFFFLWLMLLLIFRSIDCGIDLRNYTHYFREAVSHPFSKGYSLELGYYTLESIIGLLTDNFHIFYATLAVLYLSPVLWMYRREVEMPYLTIILFLVIAPFSMYFSGLRQALAMAFAVPAFYCAQNRQKFRFLLVILAAFLFHKSSLVMLLIYPVYHLKLSRRSLLWIVPLVTGIFLLNRQIFQFLLLFLGEQYIEKYSEMASTGAYSILLLLILLLIYAFLLVRDQQLEADVVALRNLLLLCVGIQCFAPVHNIAMRMNYYFLPFVPLLIPKIANRSSEQNKVISLLSVIVMSVILTLLYFYKAYTDPDILNIYPYIPFWEH